MKRLLTLWEIMNLFDIEALTWILHELGTAEGLCATEKLFGRGGLQPTGALLKRVPEAFRISETFFRIHNLHACSGALEMATHQWERPLLDISALGEILHRLQADIVSVLKSTPFLMIAHDRSEFMDRDDLFGQDVNKSFPSAAKDISEAGNCFALECNTAAVFHLMRAAEVALRALASDRNVTFKDKPLDQQEWGTVLGALEGILKALRLADRKNWPNPRFKDSQIQFYNDAVQELRSFNEAWRRYISHARIDAFYDRDQAMSIMNHVRLFMQKLSVNIGEAKLTPIYWDSI